MTNPQPSTLKNWLKAWGFSQGNNPFESKGDATKEDDKFLNFIAEKHGMLLKEFIGPAESILFVAERGSGRTTVAKMLKLCRQNLTHYYSPALVVNLGLEELDSIEESKIEGTLFQIILSALDQWQSSSTQVLHDPNLAITLKAQSEPSLQISLNSLIDELIAKTKAIGLEFVIDGLEATSEHRCKKCLTLLEFIASLNKDNKERPLPKIWVKLILSPEAVNYFEKENQKVSANYLTNLLENKVFKKIPLEEILQIRLEHFSRVDDEPKIRSLAQLSKISDLDQQLCKAADTPQSLIKICYDLLEQHFWDTRDHSAFLQQKIGWKSFKRTLKKMNYPIRVKRQVFISYSHQDHEWLEQLRPHLQAIGKYNNLVYWVDRNKIKASEIWSEEIEKAISDSPVTLLLCSKHFFASEYITGEELPAILDASEHKETKILVLNIGPSLLSSKKVPEELKKLKELQHLPNPNKARYLMGLIGMADVEQALFETAEAVLETMDECIGNP